jgi:hypothetical protein
MKFARTALLVLFAFALIAPLAAQDKDTQVRTVHGVVMDKDDNTIPNGVVYLENKRTQAIRTYISDPHGEYRFSGLDPNVDYEIHAELNGMTSIDRTVSSFDTRKDIVINLKLDHTKSGK